MKVDRGHPRYITHRDTYNWGWTTTVVTNPTRHQAQESPLAAGEFMYPSSCYEVSACPKIVSRSKWGASSQGYRTPMHLPVPFVLIHHTYQPGFCNTSSSCMKSMRGMQNYHKNDRKWDDIGYHFCIGGTGQVYQGRGWDIEGVHSPNYNHRSVGISFIGDFTSK
ncbi:hypothetical protein ANN_07115 [Periplaneta americana]|uniref:Peptidoglycan recognition protein family domain-containing protein n=1 Tax=Periplaneta americana TaxID=6978 RepID=A0ABQ8THJ0_PERAM|nr:hypothetical protein ANN_07115 [Periplaneta americana]